MKQIFKYEIPVDDQWHQIMMRPGNKPLAVLGLVAFPDKVWFWSYHDDNKAYSEVARIFRVFGTGQPLIRDAQDINKDFEYCFHRGTAMDPHLGLVWHLFENTGRYSR